MFAILAASGAFNDWCLSKITNKVSIWKAPAVEGNYGEQLGTFATADCLWVVCGGVSGIITLLLQITASFELKSS